MADQDTAAVLRRAKEWMDTHILDTADDPPLNRREVYELVRDLALVAQAPQLSDDERHIIDLFRHSRCNPSLVVRSPLDDKMIALCDRHFPPSPEDRE